MRTEIKVGDLNLRQWGYITENVPVDGRVILEGVPRVCVVFELNEDIQVLHVELDVVEFASILVHVNQIRNEPDVSEIAQAALTPDALPDRRVKNTGAATATGPGSVANTGYIGR
jgi:hypothetical protein